MSHDFKLWPELTNSQMDFYYFQSPHKQIREDFTAEVVKVIDGDTIRVETNFRDFDTVIRFFDNAAPELSETGGPESQSWLENQILGKPVTIEVDHTNRVDKFGRILGKVIFNGSDIGEESKMFGFSVPFEQRKEGKIELFGGESGSPF